MANVERELVAISGHDGESNESLETRQGRAETERSLEICFRLKVNGRRNYWMYISIPNITTTLQRVSGAGEIVHKHNRDECALALPNDYDILKNRLRLVVAGDQLNGPFPSPSPYIKPAVSCAIIDSTVYCIGGDPDDFLEFEDIFELRGGPPLEDPDPNQEYLPRLNTLVENAAMDVETYFCCRLKAPEAGNGICHRIYTLDMRRPLSGWTQVGKPLISPRLTPLLVPYQGKLYAFSGNLPPLAFAEVYDPVSDTWTQLPTPPFGWLPDTHIFVVPLNGWNKLWVLSKDTKVPRVDHTYDVNSGLWEERRGSLNIRPLLTQRSHLVSALTPQNHMVVYWIDPTQVVYAYNLSTNQLSRGRLSGARAGASHREPQFRSPLHLQHLSCNFFCVISCDYPIEYPLVSSVLHVTLVQISFKPPLKINACPKFRVTHPNSLKASVLACFAYPFHEFLHITDSYIMSNNI